MTGGVDDGDIVLRGLELPEGDVDGDTTLTLSLELVKDPGVLEGTLAELSGFLLWRWLAYGRIDEREWLEALVRGVRVGRTPVTKNPDAEILPKTKRGLARASPTKKLPLTRVIRQIRRRNPAHVQAQKMCAYLLELLDGTLVDTTALVDKVWSVRERRASRLQG